MRWMWIAALTLLPGFATASAATVNGTWHIDGDIAGNPVVSTCVFTEAAGKLTGTCTGTDGKVVQISGGIKDTSISWSYDSVYEGGTITLSYTATQDKDGHMTGSVTVPQYSATGDFTAKRD